MRFAVRRLRLRGRVLDRIEVANQQPVIGDLRVEEVLDALLGRYIRTARLRSDTHALGDSLLPDLLDAHLVSMSPTAFSLTGFERVAASEYAQSWLVTAGGAVTTHHES